MVAEPFIIPKLQTSLESLEAEGVAATLLMCAGTFSSLKGFKPIIKPFDLGSALLQMLNQKTIGVIAPFVGQIAPIEERWQNAGFRTTVWAADLAAHDQVFLEELEHRIISKQLDCIVLDYFGHPIVQVQQLQSSIEVPVIDLGQLAIVTMASSLGY